MRLQLFLLGAWYPHLYSVHIINVITVKIIGFCNIQFICPVPHEKSLTLPNWFCLSFSPLRGPALLMPWYDMTTAQLNICTLSLSSFLLQRRKMAGGSPLNVRSSYHGSDWSFSAGQISIASRNCAASPHIHPAPAPPRHHQCIKISIVQAATAPSPQSALGLILSHECEGCSANTSSNICPSPLSSTASTIYSLVKYCQ